MLRLRSTIDCTTPGDSASESCIGCQISICSHLDAAGLDRLRAMSWTIKFAKNKMLFEQGEVLDRVCIISVGVVKLVHLLPDGQKQITGFLGPGDILGGIKRQENAHGSAKALTAVEACAFNRENFLQLIKDYPDLCLNLLTAATDEIEALTDHIVLLGRKRAPQRLAAFLLMMSQRWNADTDTANNNGTMVHLPMPRADIADHLGLTIETVSRTFGLFRSSKFISIPRPNDIVLSNLAALYDLAGFDEIPTRHVALGL